MIMQYHKEKSTTMFPKYTPFSMMLLLSFVTFTSATTAVVNVNWMQDSAVNASACKPSDASANKCNMRSSIKYCSQYMINSLDVCSIYLPGDCDAYLNIPTYGSLDITAMKGKLSIFGNGCTLHPTAPSSDLASSALSIHNTGADFSFVLYDITFDAFGGTTVKGGGINIQSTSNIILQNITFQSMHAESGGGIYAKTATKIKLVECTFTRNNATQYGSAVYADGACSDWSTQDSTFSHNKVLQQHGTFYIESFADVFKFYRNDFLYNQVSQKGGSVYVGSYSTDITITNTSFQHNNAAYGAGVYFDAGTNKLFVSNCTFASNVAANDGGGVCCADSVRTVSIIDSTFTSNTAQRGAAVNFGSYANTMVLRNVLFLSNTATDGGGGLYIQQYCTYWTIAQCRFENNIAQAGSAVMSFQGNSYMTITNTLFKSNIGGYAGTFYMDTYHYQVRFDKCEFIGNTASSGASIHSINGNNYMTITSCIFSDNVGAYGSALLINTMTSYTKIVDSIFERNMATTGGGALSLGDFVTYTDVINCTFVDNSAGFSGGALVTSGAVYYLTFKGCNFTDNFSNRFAGALFFNDQSNSGLVEDCTFSRNKALNNGGAIYFAYRVSYSSVVRSVFIENEAIYGGGLYLDSQNTQNFVVDCTFINNYASTSGGAIALKDSNFIFDVSGSTFIGNRAGSYGGAISLKSANSAVAISTCSFQDNVALIAGGGVHSSLANYNLEVFDCQFTTNTASFGGGMFLGEDHVNVTLLSCTLNLNAAEEGGGLYAEKFVTNLIVNDCEFSGNDGNRGGGVCILGDSNYITESHFTQNVASESGGAIYLQSDHTRITQSNFSNNMATQQGAAVYITYSSSINISNSNFDYGKSIIGGGVFIGDSDDISVSTCNYTSNTARSGGAVAQLRSSGVSIRSSLFSNNTAHVGGAIFANAISTINILESYFTGNSVWLNGGALYVLDSDSLTLRTSHFTSNVALVGSGSGVWMSGASLSFSSCYFDDNIAKSGAGAVYWEFHSEMDEPAGLSNGGVIFSEGNSALYGSGYATEGTHITVQQGLEVNITNYDVPVPLLAVHLRDFYGQVVATENDAVVKFSVAEPYFQDEACYDGSGYVTGGTVGTMVKGVSNFTALEAYCAPGYSMLLNTSCDTVSTSLGSTALESSVTVHFRKCTRGEIYASKTCQACPNGTYSLVDNSDLSVTDCKTCPTNAKECRGDKMRLKRGYWRITTQSSTVLACPLGTGSCAGGWGTGRDLCAEGHEGMLCAVCSDGYHLSSSSGVCEKCGNSSWKDPLLMCALIVFAIALLGGALTFYQVKKSQHLNNDLIATFLNWLIKIRCIEPSATEEYRALIFRTKKHLQARLKIYLIACQIISAMPFVLEFQFPTLSANILSVFGILNLSLSHSSLTGCSSGGLDYIDRLLIDTLFPIAVLVILAAVYVLHVLHIWSMTDSTTCDQKISAARSLYLMLAVGFTYVTLPAISTSIFRTFPCQNIDPDDTADGDNWYMRSDYSISCSSSRYYFGATYATAMLIVYPVCVPLAYYFLLRHYRDVIYTRHVPLKSQAAVNTRHIKLRPLLILCDIYAPDRWYFEIVETCFRVFLTGVLVLIRPGSALQIVTGAVFTLVFIKLYNNSKSFGVKYIGSLKEASMWQVFAVLFIALMIRTNVIDNSSTTAIALLILALFWSVLYEVIRFVSEVCRAVFWHHGTAVTAIGDWGENASAASLQARIEETKSLLHELESQLEKTNEDGLGSVDDDNGDGGSGMEGNVDVVISPLSNHGQQDSSSSPSAVAHLRSGDNDGVVSSGEMLEDEEGGIGMSYTRQKTMSMA